MTALTSTPFFRRSLQSWWTLPGINIPLLPRQPASDKQAQLYLGSVCGLSGLSFAHALDTAVSEQQPSRPQELATTHSQEQH